jgi:hypothetical protein
MSIGLLFWVIMVIVLIFGLARNAPQFAPYGWGWDWLVYILLFLLGWHAFGFVIHA